MCSRQSFFPQTLFFYFRFNYQYYENKTRDMSVVKKTVSSATSVQQSSASQTYTMKSTSTSTSVKTASSSHKVCVIFDLSKYGKIRQKYFLHYRGKYWRNNTNDCFINMNHLLADLRGCQGRPSPSVQFFKKNPYSIWGKMAKILGWHPPSRKSGSVTAICLNVIDFFVHFKIYMHDALMLFFKKFCPAN